MLETDQKYHFFKAEERYCNGSHYWPKTGGLVGCIVVRREWLRVVVH